LKAVCSQFPFWDFVECNLAYSNGWNDATTFISQFPFWDFVECNPGGGVGWKGMRMTCRLSIPFLGFR